MNEIHQQLHGYRIVTVDVFYYMPDYQHIVQQFIWQTPDKVPELYRVHQFLNYWHKNIEAIIQEILISYDPKIGPTKYTSVDHFFSVN